MARTFSFLLACLYLSACGLSSEANSVTKKYLSTKVAHCNGHLYSSRKDGGIHELRELSWGIKEEVFSEADRLNGREYYATVYFKYGATRGFDDRRKCWGKWEEPSNWYFPLYAHIDRWKGSWKIVSDTWFGGDFDDFLAPECRVIPQGPSCT